MDGSDPRHRGDHAAVARRAARPAAPAAKADDHPAAEGAASRARRPAAVNCLSRMLTYTAAPMANRRKTRELAMQTLFLWDAAGSPEPEVAGQLVADATDDHDVRRDALAMANGTWSQREQIDAWIERLAPQWPPRRQPGVDRSLIRLAVWELTNTDTPPKVVIDEAIELAKEFSTENSPAFVNGVLDSVLKEKNALTGEKRSQEPEARSQETAPPSGS